MNQENMTDMVKKVFLEESFPQLSKDKGAVLNESFDEEEFSDKQIILENLTKFWVLPSLQQKKFVKNFPLILEKLGTDNYQQLITTIFIDNIDKLDDNFELAELMSKSINLLFRYFKTQINKFDKPLEIQKNTQEILVKFLQAGITAKKRLLNLASKRAILENSEYLISLIYNNNLLCLILTLLNDPEKEINKISGLHLLAELYKGFNEENISGFIFQSIYSEMQTNIDKIRIEAFNTFFKTIEVFPKEFVFSKGLKLVEEMSNDKTNDIKLCFIDNLALLAKVLPYTLFDQRILDIYLKNMKSKNRFIKEESIKVIGKIIKSLLEEKTSNELSLILATDSNFFKLIEVFFNIPTQLKRLNFITKKQIIKQNIKYLKEIMSIQNLNKYQYVKEFIEKIEKLDKAVGEIAKIELSNQFDIIARVISPNDLKKLIVKIKEYYLTIGPRTTEKVRENTLKILSSVLKVLEPSEREIYAEEYAQIIFNNLKQWRFRYVISEQMDILSQIFKIETVHLILIPVFISLCRDDCSIVRKNASKNIYKVVKNCSNDESVREVILVSVQAFGNYKRFIFRQSFLSMMEGILINCSQFVNQAMIQMLIEIAQDKVINNRICLAKLILECKKAGKYFDWEEKIFNLILKDSDFDLLNILKQVYTNDEDKLRIVNKLISNLQEKKKEEMEVEKSFIKSFLSESKSESEESQRSINDLKQILTPQHSSTILNRFQQNVIKGQNEVQIEILEQKNDQSFLEEFYSLQINSLMPNVLKNNQFEM